MINKSKRLFWIAMLSLVTGAALFSSCAGCQQKAADQPAMDSEKEKLEKLRIEELKKIFFNIPSPMEMASLIKEQGFGFDKKMLNPIENATKYTGEIKQAINLGIYGADLSYASIFDQKQESINYLAAAKTLAAAMSIEGGINDSVISKLAEYQDNRDSVLKIVAAAYGDLNGYLKENDRVEIAALIVAGGWIEGMHLCLNYVSKPKTENIRNRIAEQKLIVQELLKYYNSFNDKPSLAEMKKDLQEIQQVLDKVEITTAKTETSIASDGVMVIGNGSKTKVEDTTIKSLAELVKKIRNKYTL
jgi:hypothetical protein